MNSPIRLWFAIPHNADELNEAISSLKALCENILLDKADFIIELSAQKRIPKLKDDKDVVIG